MRTFLLLLVKFGKRQTNSVFDPSIGKVDHKLDSVIARIRTLSCKLVPQHGLDLL